MFKLESPYKPTGDQPQAIKALVDGLNAGAEAQVLLGVTGSGKTFTIANVIKEVNRPTLIMSHNKTLAAQLYSEMKAFFPHNAVEYFVSYYDYYQPEAYIPSTDLYIEKDLSINEEIDRLRLSAVAALLSGRKDVIIVSSVSCIYGLGSPQDFTANVIELKRGEVIPMDTLLKQLVAAQYVRNDIELARGRFRVKGDTIDIALAYADYIVRIEFFGNEIDAILTIDPISGQVLEEFEHYNLSPATIFLTSAERIAAAKEQIKADLAKQIEYFIDLGEELLHAEVVGGVLVHVDLLQDDPPLGLHGLLVEFGAEHHVPEDIQGLGQVVVQDVAVEAGTLLGGEGVHLSADGVGLPGDVGGGAALGALEEHMLDEVGRAGLLVRLLPGAPGDPEAQGGGADGVDLLRHQPHAVGQGFDLSHRIRILVSLGWFDYEFVLTACR